MSNSNNINFTNFHDATQAIFTPCEKPNRKPDFESPSGSVYWSVEGGVIRQADHWVGTAQAAGQCTNIRSCFWSIKNGMDVFYNTEKKQYFTANKKIYEEKKNEINFYSVSEEKNVRNGKTYFSAIGYYFQDEKYVNDEKEYCGFCAYENFMSTEEIPNISVAKKKSILERIRRSNEQ